MSNKVTIKAQLLNAPDNDLLGEFNSGLLEKVITQSGNDYTVGTQSIGSSAEEQIVVSDEIATQGYWLIINTDDENFVQVGYADVSSANDARPVKIKPGEFVLFRANGAIYAQADTSDVKIKFYCLED
jgi:hypothetical protein